MDTPASLLAFCVIIFLSAATQALTGFGFGLVALAVLALWVDLREAVVLIAPAGLALNLVLFLKLRKEFSWDGLVPLLLACLAGVPVGTWLLLNLGAHGLKLMMGAVMIITAAHRIWLLRQSTVHHWHPWKAGIPCGLLSGVLSGAFGAGGPPVVSYLINRPINRFRYVASMQMVAGLSSCIRLVQFGHAGRYTSHDLFTIIPSLGAVSLGVLVGTRLLHKISDQAVRQVIIGFLLLCGVYYLVRS